MQISIKAMTRLVQKHETVFTTALLIASVLLVCLLILPALFAKPIADDFSYFNNISTFSVADYVAQFYTNETGRYAQALSIAVLYKLFGSSSVVIGPVIEILAFIAVSIWVAYLLLGYLKKPTRRFLKASIIGASCGSLMLLSAPSLFDSLYWLTSSTVYILSIIGILLNFGFILYLLQLKHVRWWRYLFLAVSIIVCQSFSEATSAIVIIFSGLALATAFALRQWKKHIHPQLLSISAIALTSSIIGFFIVYFSPGSRQRQSRSESQFDFHAMFIETLNNLTYLGEIFFSWRAFIILGIGFTIALFMPKLSKLHKIVGVCIGLLLTFLPLYITLIISTYSMGDYIPFRLYTMPFALASLGLSIITAIAIQSLLGLIKRPVVASTTLPILSVTFVFIGFILALPPVFDVLRAEILRASLYDARESSIRAQLSTNSDTIRVTPAPIILELSEAGDLSYEDKQVSWLVDSFEKYYGISGKKIILGDEAPTGYCLFTQAPTWYGVETCSRQHLQ